MNSIDRRRNLGPANAQSLNFDTEDIVQDDSSNVDTNVINETPKIFIKSGTVHSANGSSYIESDGTIISAMVYGPRPKFNKGFNAQASVRVTLNTKNFVNLEEIKTGTEDSVSDLSERQIISTIQSTLTDSCLKLVLLKNYPKSAIEIFVDILMLNESHSLTLLLSIIQNATNIALLNSGLNLRSVPACGYIYDEGNELSINCCHGFYYDTDNDEQGEEILCLYSGSIKNPICFGKSVQKCMLQAKEVRQEMNRFLLSQ